MDFTYVLYWKSFMWLPKFVFQMTKDLEERPSNELERLAIVNAS